MRNKIWIFLLCRRHFRLLYLATLPMSSAPTARSNFNCHPGSVGSRLRFCGNPAGPVFTWLLPGQPYHIPGRNSFFVVNYKLVVSGCDVLFPVLNFSGGNDNSGFWEPDIFGFVWSVVADCQDGVVTLRWQFLKSLPGFDNLSFTWKNVNSVMGASMCCILP